MVRSIFAIARLSFKATLSEKVLQLSAFFAVGLLLLTVLLGQLAPGAGAKIVADFGLGTIQAVSTLIAIALITQDMPREIERRTLYVVLSKPISRTAVVVGKYLGLVGALAALVTVMSLIFVGVLVLQGLPVIPAFGAAIAMGALETFVLAAIALFFSLLTSPTLAAIYTLVLFMLGHQTGVIRTFGKTQSGATQWITETLYRIVPNFEAMNLKNDAIYGVLPPSTQLLAAFLYGLCLIVGFVGLSVLVFRRKEL